MLTSINLNGVCLGSKDAIRAMKKRGGSIVNVSSVPGLVGAAGAASYNAGKGGVRLRTKSPALHCAGSGYKIRVNSVHPGYRVASMVATATQAAGNAAAMQSYLVGLHPLGRLERWALSLMVCSTSPPTRPGSSPAANWSSTATTRRNSRGTIVYGAEECAGSNR